MFYYTFWAGEVLMGALITLIYAPFCARSPEGNPPFFYGEDFLGFFPEPFLRAITLATLTTATLAITIIITIAITITIIGGTPIRVKVFPFGETF